MQVELILPGKPHLAFAIEGIALYKTRLNPLLGFKEHALGFPKSFGKLAAEERKEKEGDAFSKQLKSGWCPIRLDETGKSYCSQDFAKQLEHWHLKGGKGVQFFLGGPDGFSSKFKREVPEAVALSSMTFPHDLAHLVFMEQLYRAATLWRGHPYHRN